MKPLLQMALVSLVLTACQATAVIASQDVTQKDYAEQSVEYLNTMINRQERLISRLDERIIALETNLLLLERVKGEVQIRINNNTGFGYKGYVEIKKSYYTFSVHTRPKKSEYSDSSVYDLKLSRSKKHNEETVKQVDTLIQETKAGIQLADKEKSDEEALLAGFLEKKHGYKQ